MNYLSSGFLWVIDLSLNVMKHLIEYIDEAIKLEMNVSRLYFRFYEFFPQDAAFWWRITMEEKNHAALLKNLKMAIPLVGNPPEELQSMQTDDLKITNDRINSIIASFTENDSRRKAFDIALEIEESAGELHYQTFIDSQSLSEKYKIFQHLNLEDKDHADRIRKYVADNNL